jgi:GTP-binding protein
VTRAAQDPFEVVDARFVAALAPGSRPGGAPPTFVEVAFAGRSNVGKSSLINMLVGRKGLVRTSNTPGCTRQINLFEVRARDGATLVLADLPGYGFARRSKEERRAWADLIEGYLAGRATLRALVVLVDARRGLEQDDLDLVTFARRARPAGLGALELIVVATKIDRLPRSSARAVLQRHGREVGGKLIGLSSVTGEGKPELWRAIRAATGMSSLAAETTKRHKAPESDRDDDGRRGRVQGGT